MVALPPSTVDTLPETGQSSISAPRARTWAAIALLADGLTVLISRPVWPGPRPARNPSGPSATAFRAAGSVTITNVTPAADATARGESPHPRPLSNSHCAL